MRNYIIASMFIFFPVHLLAQGAGGQVTRPVKSQQKSANTRVKSTVRSTTKSTIQTRSKTTAPSKPAGYQFVDNNFEYKVIASSEVEIGIADKSKVGEILDIPSRVRHEGVTYTVKSIRYSSMQMLDIKNLSIPSTIRSIGSMAFWYCQELKAIHIPSTTTDIDPSAFSSCSNLETIIVDPSNPKYCAPDNVLMTKDRKFLILYPASKSGYDYNVPSTVERIAKSAFANCKLNRVNIPAKTTDIDGMTFDDCGNLSIINIDPLNPVYYAPNNVLLTKDGKYLLRYPAGKTDRSYTIPSSVEHIAWGAFSSCRLETVIINNDNVDIEKYAFRDCPNLRSVTITQNTISGLPENVFSRCDNLKTITVKTPEGRIKSVPASSYK